MIKVVIFDLGGVVVKWSDDIVWKYIAERYGLDFKQTKKKLDSMLAGPESGSMSYKRMMQNFFKSVGLPMPKDYKAIWVGKFKKGAKLDKQVLRLIQRLKRSYKVAALSNIENSHKEIVREKGWLKHFDSAILSCDVKTRKPLRKIYKIALKKLNVKPKEDVFIDNLKENVESARKAGMNAILFKNADQLEKELKKYL